MAITIQVLTEDYSVAIAFQTRGFSVRRIMGGYEISIDTARDMQKAYQILTSLGLE